MARVKRAMQAAAATAGEELKVVPCSKILSPAEIRELYQQAQADRAYILEQMEKLDKQREYMDLCLTEQDLIIRLLTTRSMEVEAQLREVKDRIRAFRPMTI